MKGKHFIQKYFLAGLVVWLPILATYFVLRFVVGLLDQSLSFLPHKYQPEQLFGHDIPGLGLVFTIIIIFVTGLLFTNFIGRRLINTWEKLLARIPLIRTVYTAVKQVTSAFIKPKGESFRKVVLVQYPRKGIWSVGFVTSAEIKNTPINESMVAVFIPTTPNPTSGFLTLIPKQDALELDMTIENAFKFIISLGAVMHGDNAITPKPSTEAH